MRLHQVALHAQDVGRASAFYQEHFGAREIATFDPPGFAFLDLEGVRLLLSAQAPASAIYLSVEDVEETVARLRATGVAVLGEPHVVFEDEEGLFGEAGSSEWMAFIADSEGNEVGLASRRAAG